MSFVRKWEQIFKRSNREKKKKTRNNEEKIADRNKIDVCAMRVRARGEVANNNWDGASRSEIDILKINALLNIENRLFCCCCCCCFFSFVRLRFDSVARLSHPFLLCISVLSSWVCFWNATRVYCCWSEWCVITCTIYIPIGWWHSVLVNACQRLDIFSLIYFLLTIRLINLSFRELLFARSSPFGRSTLLRAFSIQVILFEFNSH